VDLVDAVIRPRPVVEPFQLGGLVAAVAAVGIGGILPAELGTQPAPLLAYLGQLPFEPLPGGGSRLVS
jgi:hypothetical protein